MPTPVKLRSLIVDAGISFKWIRDRGRDPAVVALHCFCWLLLSAWHRSSCRQPTPWRRVRAIWWRPSTSTAMNFSGGGSDRISTGRRCSRSSRRTWAVPGERAALPHPQ